MKLLHLLASLVNKDTVLHNRPLPSSQKPSLSKWGYSRCTTFLVDCEQSLFSQSSLSSAGLERANWPSSLASLDFLACAFLARVTILRDCSQSTFLVKMSFICMRMKNHFHIKGSALNLVLIQRPRGTQNWLIDITINMCKVPVFYIFNYISVVSVTIIPKRNQNLLFLLWLS